ncbi:hypothetical protein EfmJHP10_24640 [Enterococcus faecium]|nr:hypothetical protein EfmJHP10_24640 [Enterococcus faecium]
MVIKFLSPVCMKKLDVCSISTIFIFSVSSISDTTAVTENDKAVGIKGALIERAGLITLLITANISKIRNDGFQWLFLCKGPI